jgi:hypothetical protein
MVGTSLFKAGYNFAEQLDLERLDPVPDVFSWLKNPAGGKQVEHYATGVKTDIYHLVENADHRHWDLAGEIVLNYQHNTVFPFGYFYDIIVDDWKIVISPIQEEDAEEGTTYIVGLADTEGAAKVAVIMMWAEMKGMHFQPEPVKEAPLQQASL